MIIIASTIGCAFLGWTAGWLLGEAEGGDYNFAPIMYAPMGALILAIVGCVLSAILT